MGPPRTPAERSRPTAYRAWRTAWTSRLTDAGHERVARVLNVVYHPHARSYVDTLEEFRPPDGRHRSSRMTQVALSPGLGRGGRRSRLVHMTTAQALVRFLSVQHTGRDGERQRLFGGMFGIFGHGNVTGIGQALEERASDMPYYQARNEQAMVHAALAYARQRRRLATLACTSSIG